MLAYHSVDTCAPADDPHRLVLHPRLFARQLDLLRRAGYSFETATSWSRQPGTAVITFDDGWLADARVVAPMLARVGVEATFFVCPGWFGGQHPEVAGSAGRLAAARDVADLVSAGHEVGSHSLLHRDLRLLPDDALASDLAQARSEIERVTDAPCTSFAYPYGLFDERVESAVERAGHTVAYGWGSASPDRVAGPLAMPRIPAPPRHGALRLALKMLGVRRSA